MQPADSNDRSGSAARLTQVSADEAGQRIDNYLLRCLKGVPRSRVYRLLRRGEVRVNSRRVDAAYRVEAGDRVRIPPVRQTVAPRRPQARGGPAIAVLHEDDRLLVVDKPAGAAVHGGSGVTAGLIDHLRAARPDARFLELVHRLDRDTSGCLMIAKKRSALRTLHALMREGAVEKRYLALVAGDWQNAGVVDAALDTTHRRGGERIVRVDAQGKAAASRFHTLERYGIATLVEVQTFSGRTHQIRVHAAHAGHPLAGDDKYGDPQFDEAMRARGLRRLFLHAHVIAFEWPDTGEAVHVTAPLPEALRALLDTFEPIDARGGRAGRRGRPAGQGKRPAKRGGAGRRPRGG
jgi:23S rRNA pseudouridine955/2504/2580 synthase